METENTMAKTKQRIVEYRGHNFPAVGDSRHLFSFISYDCSFNREERLKLTAFQNEMDSRLRASGEGHYLSAILNLDTGEIFPVEKR